MHIVRIIYTNLFDIIRQYSVSDVTIDIIEKMH